MTSAARRIARFAQGLRAEDLPAPVLHAAKLHLVDAIGVGLAASTVPLSAPWIDGVRRIGDGGRAATVLGQGEPLAPAMAALANGTLIQSLEFDDTHIASVVHGGAVAAPAALAAAEESGAGGARLLAGFVAAWEVMIRLGLAAPGAYQANGFQVSAAGGAVGAAVAGAAIEGLDEDRAVRALGIAGSEASGLLAFLADGSTVKSLHAGWAAHTGLAATALAAAGLAGPEAILEGRFGFLESFARDPTAPERLEGHLLTLGDTWHLPEAAFKLYPCCHYIHPFLESTRAIIDSGLRRDEIASITCHVPPPMAPLVCDPWERRQSPASGYDAKWALAYCIAALLAQGRVDVATFAGEPDPAVSDLARRIDWRPLEPHGFPARFEAMVEVHHRDGRTARHRVENVRGAPDRPIPETGVLAKFRANAGRAMHAEAVETLLHAILTLDEAKTSAALTAALRAAVTPSGPAGR